MDPTRWAMIGSLCEQALALPESARESWLHAEAGDDPALLAEVRSLLEHLAAEPDYLETPIANLRHPAATTVPETIGPYRIERLVGQGGMGEVFLARDEAGQALAVKVIRAGKDTAALLNRFALESRILAALDHPHIARLLDSGIDRGRPWVAMQFVSGESILDHCDRARLGLDQRLALFLDVADAVAHAHRHLVVHRDLKPANILVTADGNLTLLDFGISKIVGESATISGLSETRDADRLLTVEYAAPEQLRGDPVSTSTDVHGLGILLHQLLTGLHPFRTDGDSLLAVERAILETAPGRPSERVVSAGERGPVGASSSRQAALLRGLNDSAAHSRRLRGDLDTIVLMALRKEPERRYPSVDAMADDVRRHLAGLPVRARPDTLGYRARKFVRRNAGAVTLVVLLLIGLAATTAIATLASWRAARAATAAAAERDQALAVRNFLLEMFGSSDPGGTVGSSVTVRAMLDRRAEQLRDQPDTNPALRATMFSTMSEAYGRLGEYDVAAELAERALTARRSFQAADDPLLNGALMAYAWALHQAGRSVEADSLLALALTAERAAVPPRPALLSRALNDRGVVLTSMSRFDSAAVLLSEALALRSGGPGSTPLSIGITANNLAAAYYFQAKLDSAATIQAVALEALDRAVGSDHQRSVIALANLAAFRQANGDQDGAIGDYRALLARQTRLQGAAHPVTARVMAALGTLLGDRVATADSSRSLLEADSLLRRALTLQRAALGPDHPQVGVTLDRWSGVLRREGLQTTADSASRAAVTILTRAHGAEHQTVATARLRHALVLAELGQAARAIQVADSGVATMERLLGPSHPETARAIGRQCEVLVIAARSQRAVAVCGQAARRLRTAPPGYARDRHRVDTLLATATAAAY